jgi:hypothetical protein
MGNGVGHERAPEHPRRRRETLRDDHTQKEPEGLRE